MLLIYWIETINLYVNNYITYLIPLQCDHSSFHSWSSPKKNIALSTRKKLNMLKYNHYFLFFIWSEKCGWNLFYVSKYWNTQKRKYMIRNGNVINEEIQNSRSIHWIYIVNCVFFFHYSKFEISPFLTKFENNNCQKCAFMW